MPYVSLSLFLFNLGFHLPSDIFQITYVSSFSSMLYNCLLSTHLFIFSFLSVVNSPHLWYFHLIYNLTMWCHLTPLILQFTLIFLSFLISPNATTYNVLAGLSSANPQVANIFPQALSLRPLARGKASPKGWGNDCKRNGTDIIVDLCKWSAKLTITSVT